MDQAPSLDLLRDLQLLLEFHFMQNALVVGTAVAILAGAIGYFVVLRGQSFAAHMLAQVGFPGAAAAGLVHLAPVAGLLTFCVAAAVGVTATGSRDGGGQRVESAAVGTLLAFSLALGLLFARLASGSSQAIYAFLFGTVLGISDADRLVVLVTAGTCLAVLGLVCRPLLLSSLDPAVATARGLPVRGLGVLFMVITAVAVAESVQVVGTLLIFALLVAPAATAQRLTARPYRGMVISILMALTFTWSGLAMAYFTNLPVGFLVATMAFAAYLGSRGVAVLSPRPT